MLRLKTWLFPTIPRNFFGKRWLQISLRTLHLCGVAGLTGGIIYGLATEQWLGFLHLTLASGICYFLIDIYCNAMTLIQLRGLVIFIKLALLGILYYLPEHSHVIFSIIVISSLISHAPGNVRYFSLPHWKRMDTLDGKKVC